MAVTFKIVEGMTRPTLDATLYRGTIATRADLTSATVKLYVQASGTFIVDGEAMTILTAADGTVRYIFDATETTTPDTYSAQIEVTHSDGGVERNTDDFVVSIIDALD